MPSPFPGMDPYLEDGQHWPIFHQQFISALSDAMQSALSDRYRVKAGYRSYETELVLFTSVHKETQREPFLEIRHKSSSDKLITVFDLASPANRNHATGRTMFRKHEEEVKNHGGHLVQIDLLLEGQTAIDADFSCLTDRQYLVSVHRSPKFGKPELYGCTLRQRLPRIRIPILPDDRDLVLDIQALVNRVYERCFGSKIDYTKPAPVNMNDDDDKWLRELLTKV